MTSFHTAREFPYVYQKLKAKKAPNNYDSMTVTNTQLEAKTHIITMLLYL